jgi:hypothetical protein
MSTSLGNLVESATNGDVAAWLRVSSRAQASSSFVKDGCLKMLDDHSYDESWPKLAKEFEVSYETEALVALGAELGLGVGHHEEASLLSLSRSIGRFTDCRATSIR